jgi:hypothetical protein
MRFPLSVLVSLSLTTLAGATALAQPAAAQPEVAASAAPERNWGIGVHLGGLGLEPRNADGDELTEGTSDKIDLGAAGLQLRYRLHRRWELELAATHLAGELGDTGAERHSGALVLGVMFHINPDANWRWSGLFGIGGVHDEISVEKNGERVTTAEFAEGMVRLGIGLERRFDRWGIEAELYGVGFQRNDEKLDGPAYEGRDGGPVPAHSSGGEFLLLGNYYF